MILFLVFVAALLLLYHTKGNSIILYLPVTIFLAEVLFPLVYGPSSEITSSQIKVIFFTFLFSIFIFLRIIYNGRYILTVYVITPFLFLVIAYLNSSVLWDGIKQVIRISVPLLAFPAYYIYFKRNGGLEKYLKNIMLFALLFILLIAVSSILQVGTYWSYGEKRIGGIYFFGVNLWELYSLSYAAMFLYFLKDKYKLNKMAIEVLFFAILVILLLIYKRGLLIPMGLTLVFYYYYNFKRLNALKIFAGIVAAYIFLAPFVGQILASINERKDTLQLSSYAEEGRTKELAVYFDYYWGTLGFFESMIGQDFFNSGGKFQVMQDTLVDEERILHSDLANLLYTTGILGTLAFYSYLVAIYLKFLRYKRGIDPLLRYLFYAFFISLILKQMVEGLNMSLNYFIPLSIMGALFGVFEREKQLAAEQDTN